MSLSDNLMNRFRWEERFFNNIFWLPGLEFSLPFPYVLSSRREVPTADPKWVSGVVHSPVIAEPPVRTVGTRPAS